MISFAPNATAIAKNINRTRIKINIHVWSLIQPQKDDAEPLPATAAPALTERATAGVENGVLVLNGPVSVMLTPSSSFVCRTACKRTW